jgi:hypothetical protein
MGSKRIVSPKSPKKIHCQRANSILHSTRHRLWGSAAYSNLDDHNLCKAPLCFHGWSLRNHFHGLPAECCMHAIPHTHQYRHCVHTRYNPISVSLLEAHFEKTDNENDACRWYKFPCSCSVYPFHFSFISGAAGSRMIPARLLSVPRARDVPWAGMSYARSYGYLNLLCIIRKLRKSMVRAILSCLTIRGSVDRRLAVRCCILA